ncbi:hypothetical protein HAX54_045357 [Datura stramonium]|uniref:Acid phosphatase n=1 Tax=Datura stramonium TaxID=4076 RepID=A0ABS8WHP9_DATST|nr:hypothetical protein [Datura stramonium]
MTITMRSFTFLFFFSTIVAVALTSTFDNVEAISQVVEIHRLRPQTGAAGYPVPQLDCSAGASLWRPTTSGTGNWCLNSVKTIDGKDVWVFDIDETTLSNLPGYARSDVAFGAIAYNNTKFNEWLAEGKLPAIPLILPGTRRCCLWGSLVFITGARDNFETIKDCQSQESWGENDSGLAVEITAREQSCKAETELLGNMGL